MSSSVNTAVRDTRRARKLGGDVVCVICGENDPVPMLYELHHLAGRANDPDLTGRVCRNCHAKQTEALRAGGVSMGAPPSALHRLAALLGGAAEFLAHLAASLTGWSRWLLLLIGWLDDTLPDWAGQLAALPAARQLTPVLS